MNPLKHCLTLLALACAGYAQAQALAPAPDCGARAEAVLAALDGGHYDQARADFDARMLQGLSGEQLAQVWKSLPLQAGERRSRGELQTRVEGESSVAVIPLEHAKAWLELQIHCSADGKVAGLWVRPGRAPAPPDTEASASPDWSERAIEIDGGGPKLPGTLTLPAAKLVAGVVLVHGSGPHDRDQTIGPNRVFRDLAHGLARQGIAVLRYDKRTQVAPAGFVNAAFTVREEVTDDAVAAIKLLRAQPELQDQPVYVLGHSLGALLAPRIAEQAGADGLVMLAAPARPLHELIPRQVNYLINLDGTVSDEEKAAEAQTTADIAKVRALTEADAKDPTPILGLPPAYWLDLHAYQHLAQARALGKPILLLQGEADYQVTMNEDFQIWQHRLRDAPQYVGKSYPGLNHLFMPAGTPPGPDDYQKAGHVDAAVIADIGEWLKDTSRVP